MCELQSHSVANNNRSSSHSKNKKQQNRRKQRQLPVFVTGHSMGGALASLNAVDLALQLGGHHVMCSTFGSPRVGNAAFQRMHDAIGFPAWRFTNSHDPVTRVPTTSNGQKYV